jgi:hypothetical protein
MANLKPCRACKLYHAIVKPHRNGKGHTDTKKGHCLDKTIYAKNKPGKPVYPARAKVKDLEFGRHEIVLRRDNEIVPHCTAFMARKG